LQPQCALPLQIWEGAVTGVQGSSFMRASLKSRCKAFWDFFVLFSGISTASNLSRTRREPVMSRGLFLFRTPRRR